MEKYGSGTRVLLAGRSTSAAIYQTTVGSPVRFDAAVVSGCVELPAYGSLRNSSYLQVPIVGDKTSITTTPLFASIRAQYTGAYGSGANGLSSWIEFLRPSGQVVAKLSNTASSSSFFAFFVYNGTTFTQVGASHGVGLNVLTKFDVKAIPGVGGELSLWVDGVSVIQNIGGLNANFDEIAFVRYHNFGASGVAYLSEYALADEDIRSYNFGSDAITGAGFYNDGTGVATDTADTDLNSFKGLPANGNKYTGTTPARSLPGNTVIDSVMLSSVMRTAAPIGNAKALLRLSSADYTSANVAPVPNAGYELRMPYYDNNPATGLPWAIADYNSAEKGNEAAT